MIGRAALRRVGAICLIAVAVGAGLGLRAADPSEADPPAAASRERSLEQVISAAEQSLRQLSEALGEALRHARRGSAQTMAGVEPPAMELDAAAVEVASAAEAADAVRRRLRALAGTAASVTPSTQVPGLGIAGSDLLLVADQLRSSEEAATRFFERREATQAALGALRDALVALQRNDPQAALDSLDGAAAPLALLDAWTERPAYVGYWLEVSRALLGAVRGVATATLAGDQAAQHAAADAYARTATAARGADNGLAVALSEEGDAVTRGPLQGLAAAAEETRTTLGEVEGLQSGVR